MTNSKNHQKVITHNIGQEFIDEANHIRHDQHLKSVYRVREETIERVFADAKKHDMRYTHLRSLAKVNTEVTFIYACINSKKMASNLWKMCVSYRSNSIFSKQNIKIYTLNFIKIAKSIFSD
ncbi:transposase [Clostridium paraputrificum]|uniref:transposase n=1 Tax=Clostridium paraputrificum TaxID=29363 RepID=UPI003D6BF71F